MSPTLADRDVEIELAQSFGTVVGLDEVGRGALAGPVCVGAVLVQETMGTLPAGLTDSKLLTVTQRETLVDPIKNWSTAWALGWASVSEIDSEGIIAALQLAALRALAELPKAGAVLLDGKQNWISDKFRSLTANQEERRTFSKYKEVPIRTLVRADSSCSVVAAASVLAKVARDQYMANLEDKGYRWDENKGYGTAAHRQAIREIGVSEHHRRSWKLG